MAGIVVEQPEVTLKSQKLLVSIPKHKGKALITTNLSPVFSYGDEILVNCKMREPKAFDSFRYDLYLKKDGIFWTCSYPRIVKTRSGQGSFFKQEIFKLKTGIIARVNTLFPEPHGSLLLGLIVGTRAALPENLSAPARPRAAPRAQRSAPVYPRSDIHASRSSHVQCTDEAHSRARRRS
jgi:hypothetical protein